MINSALFRLNCSDFSKGLAIAVLGAILGILQQGLQLHGFDFPAYDWAGIFDLAWKVAVVYLSKNLLSDSDGKVLGHIG